MAHEIHCDVHDRSHLADVMVTQLANGETFAACTAGYAEMCRAIVDAMNAEEQDAAAAEAERHLSHLGPPDPYPTSPASSPADDPAAEPPTNAAGVPASRKRGRNTAPEIIAPESPS